MITERVLFEQSEGPGHHRQQTMLVLTAATLPSWRDDSVIFRDYERYEGTSERTTLITATARDLTYALECFGYTVERTT